MRHILGILRSTCGYQLEDVAPMLTRPASSWAGNLQQPQKDHRPATLKAPPQEDLSRYEPETAATPIETAIATSEPPSTSERSSTTLADLPADVLFLISDHLDAPSAHSLALTCRGFYSVGFPQTRRKLEVEDKKELLTILERDGFSDGFYYCPRCVKLRPYTLTFGPQSPDEGSDKTRAHVCGTRDRFTPMGNPYDLGYHHARLVMNSHFYGPKHGIPLGNICTEHDAPREKTTVHCSTAANIISDELFLRRTYTFQISNRDAQQLRQCTGHRDFRLCEHLPFFRNSSIYHQALPELARQPRNTANHDQFVPCTNSPGSCGLCLLDYDVTISRVDCGQAWKVKIDAYHQLGDCRSPDDWKWARFTEKSRPHLFLPNRPNRRGSGYNPGAVKRRWLQGPPETVVDANVNNSKAKRHSI